MNPDSLLSDSNLSIHVQQLLAEVTYKKIREILAEKGIEILLLKGPHLGNTVYDSSKDRLYGDLDILVRPDDFEMAAAVLSENGFKPFAFDRFPLEIQQDFKHWEYRSPWGTIVELHRWLSGHDRYPVDSAGLFARAEKFDFGETPALGLAAEDLLLHLCLHMGTSYFHVIERKHVTDISLLIKKRKVDWPVLLQRVIQSGAKSIAYYALLAAQRQDNAAVPADILRRLRPGNLHRLWLEKNLDPDEFPIYRFPGHSMSKIKRRLLLPLMDNPSQWLGFFRRMAATKLRMIFRIMRGTK